ncbi:bifunctional adenosylcobinamide kinase/adenosylcobinamide-phosphate guanylyltransferase [Acinetobacter pittii]|uniref:bifunctional adenosylcobinamide kinase/adenosylcobinamide-phosphate guanylyltransferase n=1 Tax=Acinetobacter pittii TaxID=48296 RepID=UPI001F2FBAAA|nr:bifunctional adenosylcobinamide kinase/adenosylcobinamide-phosphate guanylyltransferase [Acinetobacter pittii]MCE6235040.1 bifunctional adenosylcobinamide kinase/adenosylcobinamide-phosphate guanylyltransferase [Acinetobacter pittii]MCE6690262.1 bifunctional adenosylcobinamide kinase/adenosylcobinamide-phosphate guanylyltransferase [Acinetobacter pittii]MCE6697246.1 bifunctional adenosylcobinamide kinase/adenosylcobinamide-phosphate guanylyltransferase [Acinetobacter pittii]MCU4526476.1 bifu
MLQLILGGARSGKSRLAEQTAINMQLAVTYVATAQALDPEMQNRIEHHQNQRPAHWSLVEEPLYLANALQKIDRPNQIILVDCLTLWLTNLLLLEDQNVQQFECEQLLKVLPTLQSEIILVSNETGLGVVPLGEISRRFVDEAGRLHQSLGQIADKVVFCVAGFPMILKGEK